MALIETSGLPGEAALFAKSSGLITGKLVSKICRKGLQSQKRLQSLFLKVKYWQRLFVFA